MPLELLTRKLSDSAIDQVKKLTKNIQALRRRHTDSTLHGGAKDSPARRLAEVDPEVVKVWATSFDALLADKIGLGLFSGFLKTEHSVENIDFWIAVEEYKQAKSAKQLASMALNIYETFVAVGSANEVNLLDSVTRQETFEEVTSNPTVATFDHAQNRVKVLMERDSYTRFLDSELIKDLANGNLQKKH